MKCRLTTDKMRELASAAGMKVPATFILDLIERQGHDRFEYTITRLAGFFGEKPVIDFLIEMSGLPVKAQIEKLQKAGIENSRILGCIDRHGLNLIKLRELDNTDYNQGEIVVLCSSEVAGIFLRTGNIFFDGTDLVIQKGDQCLSMSVNDISVFKMNEGIIWDDFDIFLKNRRRHNVDGFKKAESAIFLKRFNDVFIQKYTEYCCVRCNELVSELNELSRQSKERFLRRREVASLIDKAKAIFKDYDSQRIDSRADTENITFVREFLDNPEKWLAEHNDIFIENEKKKFKDYFNTVEANPLTLSQQRAVIANEENNLIIAGAGSGKTSVIVARVGYILKKEFASPEEILVLAFNRKAKEELEERIQEKLDVSIDVHTFHSFGLKVIAESQNEKPSLCRWCGDRHALNQLIRNLILDNYQKDNFRELFDQYFIQHFIPYKNQNEFKNKGDYYSYLKNFDLRTLNDEQVKSYEELEIANFLRLKNIKYEYERPYEKRTATREHKQYQPDFYLPDDKIYIEHFGVDRKGNTAPFVNAKKYRQGANWKIQQHQKHGTKLVKTYSFEKQEGCLTSNLEQKLITHGVEIGHVSFNDALSLFNEKQVFDKFSKLIVSFMNHYESNSFTVQSLKVKFSNHQSREHAFLTVFEAVYDSYLQKKSADACIDFNDMILQATKDIQQGKYLSPYKHILVDEFQDISTARSNLITELRKLVDESVVTVVGDDWQSINRFAGSDVAIMKNFQKHYGMTEVTCLENTFRFDKSICDIATKFILKNRSQIEKTVTPFNHSKKSEIYVYWYAENSDDRLGSVMKELAKKTNGEALETVYILGRYNFLEPENLRGMQNEYRRKFDISFRTVHTSKGREADHVIVFGLDSGKYGFPSEIQDDPLLNMVLTESDEFPFSEERRLFYVAMTRTKEKLFFVSNMNNRSSFIDELFADNPTEIIELNGKYRDFKLCPDCKEGSIVQRTNNQDNSTFYGCSNYPYCEYTASTLSAIPNATRQQRCDTGSNRVQTVNRKRRNIAGPNRVCNTEFVPGQIVQHDKFGLGRVKEYWDLGEDSIVVVRFNSGNTKSLMVKYAKLRNN